MSMHSIPRFASISVVLLLCCGCTSDRETPDAASSETADGGDTAARPDAAAPQDSILQSAAVRVVAFLQGAATWETVTMADTVELMLAEEGGGARHRLGRDALRDRDAWVIDSNGQQHSFVPSATFTEMRVAPGVHFNCVPGPLSARLPGLPSSPHVGVRLTAPGADSCLQGWNATFVFDTAGGTPRLTAAVYDQWEW